MTDTNFPTILTITEEDIDLNQVLKKITLPSTGAACFFSGMVRGITTRGETKITDHLEYTAYDSMALAKMQQVADEIREQFPTVQGIAIVHRIGILQPETPTVLIACTAPHRDTGVFEAARYGIDRLKQIVPIWKKEVGTNGEEWISEGYIPTEEDLNNLA
jgi:molybdopterin synthase catalytic subunit